VLGADIPADANNARWTVTAWQTLDFPPPVEPPATGT
jgi:hypothetical protein